MSGFTIKVQIEAPELAAAINNVAEVFKNRPVTFPVAPVGIVEAVAEQTPPPTEKSVTAPATAPVTAPVTAPATAPTDAPATGAVNGGASVPTNAPAPVPVEAPAPVNTAISDPVPAGKTYTFDDITNAGAQVLEAGKMNELMKLLKDGYGVQAVTQLKPEQYATIADDLRKLGANI